MLPIALMLAAAPVYVDPYEAPSRPRVDADLRDDNAYFDESFHRVGFTGRLGAAFSLPDSQQAGVEGALGVRYALREPYGGETYFSPALSFLLTGGIALPTGPSEVVPLDGTYGPMQVGVQKRVGTDARIELMVARHKGQLLPAFAAWVATGGELLIDDMGVRTAGHVGLGLSINFVREWVGALGRMGGGGNWGSGWHPGSFGGLGSGLGGGGGGAALLAILIAPLAIAAAVGAVFVASLMASMATIELRYTVLPTYGGIGGYGGLFVGFGV